MTEIDKVQVFRETLVSVGKQQGYDPYDIELALRRVPEYILGSWAEVCVVGNTIDLGCVQKYLGRLMR